MITVGAVSATRRSTSPGSVRSAQRASTPAGRDPAALRWLGGAEVGGDHLMAIGSQPSHGLRSDQPETARDKNLFGHLPPTAGSSPQQRIWHSLKREYHTLYGCREPDRVILITSSKHDTKTSGEDHEGRCARKSRNRQMGSGVHQTDRDTVGPLIKRWYRAEVRNVDNVPSAGGALVVSNHSGGMLTPDVLIFAPAFYDNSVTTGPSTPWPTTGLFIGPLDGWLRRLGVIEASRENAAAALHSGAVVLVFPGGDYDSYRPTFSANTRSTSTAAPATSRPPSKPGCRSCRPCRSAGRRRSCS